MILLTYKAPDGLRLGVKTEGGVVDVRGACVALGGKAVPADPVSFLRSGSGSLVRLRELVARALDATHACPWILDEASLEYGPCVPEPGKIVCVGVNYRRHAREAGLDPPPTPVLFSKFNNAIAASGDSIPLPAIAREYDYEAELAVVIGKRAKHVSGSDALDFVLGYCNANDLTARDLQLATSQWLLGKSLDRFIPIGPYLVTTDEAGEPQAMEIRGWLNGELRQDSSTADMIFTVAEIVSYISRHMTLEPGDVITTGTPEGVVFGMKDKVWLRPGDEYVVEIGQLGRLTNVMCREGEEERR